MVNEVKKELVVSEKNLLQSGYKEYHSSIADNEAYVKSFEKIFYNKNNVKCWIHIDMFNFSHIPNLKLLGTKFNSKMQLEVIYTLNNKPRQTTVDYHVLIDNSTTIEELEYLMNQYANQFSLED